MNTTTRVSLLLLLLITLCLLWLLTEADFGFVSDLMYQRALGSGEDPAPKGMLLLLVILCLLLLLPLSISIIIITTMTHSIGLVCGRDSLCRTSRVGPPRSCRDLFRDVCLPCFAGGLRRNTSVRRGSRLGTERRSEPGGWSARIMIDYSLISTV